MEIIGLLSNRLFFFCLTRLYLHLYADKNIEVHAFLTENKHHQEILLNLCYVIHFIFLTFVCSKQEFNQIHLVIVILLTYIQ